MKWYWILLIIYVYVIIGAVVSALIVGTNDDAFPALVMFWPIAVIVIILALPIKLIFDIFSLK